MFDLCAPVLGISIYLSIYIIYFDCPDSREYSEKKSMNVFLYDDIWEVGFLDFFFSLQSVFTDQELNIGVK